MTAGLLAADATAAAWSTGGAIAILCSAIVWLVKRDEAKGVTRIAGLEADLEAEREAREAERAAAVLHETEMRSAAEQREEALRAIVLDLTTKLATAEALIPKPRKRQPARPKPRPKKK